MKLKARWPLLMDKATACEYLSVTPHQLSLLIDAGLVPAPREPVSRAPRWHRRALREAAGALFGLPSPGAPERAAAESKAAAWRALDGYVFPPVRRTRAHGAPQDDHPAGTPDAAQPPPRVRRRGVSGATGRDDQGQAPGDGPRPSRSGVEP